MGKMMTRAVICALALGVDTTGAFQAPRRLSAGLQQRRLLTDNFEGTSTVHLNCVAAR